MAQYTTTTQSQFHPMRGHVDAGVSVLMDSGDVLIVKPTMRGWTLVTPSDDRVCPADQSAAQIADFIANQ